METKDIDEIICALRASGMSKEFCEEIRRNADAGSLDYAVALIGGQEDGCISVLPKQSYRYPNRRLRY